MAFTGTGTEVFADKAAATVTSGGTDAPPAGTSESWIVDVTAVFPACDESGSPATFFYLGALDGTAEIMLATSTPGGTGSQSWTVTRGACGTTPVAHVSGFTIQQLVTAETLAGLQSFPMTTAGDMIYQGSSAPARLPVGSAGEVLTVLSGGSPAWASAPVTSVNGDTGAVSVTAASIDAVPTSDLPVSIANGGTGETSASAALTALGGFASSTSLGGGLSGTLPDPTVAKVQGVAVSSTAPSSGQVLTATSSTAADWTTPAAAPVTSVNGETGAVTVTEVSGITVSGTPSSGQVLTATSSTAADWAATVNSVNGATGTVSVTAASIDAVPTSDLPLSLANGGTGQTTAQAAMNTLAGAETSGYFLRGNGTNVVMAAIETSDVPTLNQNTTGTAANVTGTVAVANGGTGETTASAALTALGGFASSTSLGGGLSGTLPDPTVAKVQNVSVSSTAPSAGQVLTATSSTAADWATPATAPVTSVNGQTGAVTVTEVDGVTVSGTPSAGEVLTATSGTAADWAAPAAATKLQGVTVSSTAPATGQVLTATSSTAADWATPTTVTYPISIADGGTGQTTASAALTALGGFASSTSLGGGLSGTLPDPTVIKVQGVTISTVAPTAGQVLTATTATAADWATPAAAPVTSVNGQTGAVTVTEVNGVTFANAPSGSGEVLTSVSSTEAEWATPIGGWTQITSGFPSGWSGSVSYRYANQPGDVVEVSIYFAMANGTTISTGQTAIGVTLPTGYYPTGTEYRFMIGSYYVNDNTSWAAQVWVTNSGELLFTPPHGISGEITDGPWYLQMLGSFALTVP